MDGLAEAHRRLLSATNLGDGIRCIDQIIEDLTAARNAIAGDPSVTAQVLSTCHKAVKGGFEHAHGHLKEIYKSHAQYQKVLEGTLRDKPLPDSQNDAVSAQSGLVDRAIIMHLLREGEFAVASQLLDDISRSPDGQLFLSTELELSPDALGPNELRRTFSSMHEIISHLRQRNLAPAIAWARENSAKLELRGSHLEFELGQLHFVHLFTGGNSPGDPARARAQALEYSRNHFGHFQKQYLDDIARLAGALAFQPNLEQSPYRHIFANADTWRKLEEAFVREFCSLLGLSAQSPLLLAVTAGAISLPTLQKLQSVMKDKRAEWTTAQELPVEMPLPSAFRFHSVFVCPVSKEQTTDENPPMMMPCGHVIAQETLARMSKGSRFKCPYCPSDSRPEDARKLVM